MNPQVLVTRPAQQAHTLCGLLEAAGLAPVRLPALAIEPVAGLAAAGAALAAVDRYHWLVFISANAVRFALMACAGRLAPGSAKVAAIGQATAAALRQHGVGVDLLPPPPFNSEALLATPPMRQVGGQRLLLVRGDGGLEQLADGLRALGAQVDYLAVYRRLPPADGGPALASLLGDGKLSVVTVTSGECLGNLRAMCGSVHLQKLLALPLVVVSHRIKAQAQALGFKRITVASAATDAAIVEAVVNTMTSGEAG